MRIGNRFWRRGAFLTLSILMVVVMTSCQGAESSALQIDNDDIGGVVTSANGPEAGVWVIAETEEFETRFARIVVTDDRDATWFPTSRAQPTTSGFAAMD